MKRTIAALLLLLLPLAAAAAVIRRGEELEIPAGEQVDDDLYVSGGTVRVAGTVNGDLVVAGGTVTVQGPVSGDLIAAGGTVVLEGPVAGSVRAAGGNLTVSGRVEQDVVVAGGTVTVKGPVGRDLLVGAGNVSVEAPVARNLLAGAGDLALRAEVGGDATIQGSRVRVGKVRIGGNLSVPENADLVVDPGAGIGGELIRTEPVGGARGPGARIFSWLRWFVGFLGLGGLLGLIAPRWWRASESALEAAPGRAVLAGVGLLLAIPIIAFAIGLLGIAIGGWWIGIFVILLQLMLLAAGLVLAAQALGRVILRTLHRGGRWFATLALGLLVLLLLAAIPYLGAAVALAAILFGGGGLLLGGVQLRRSAPQAQPAPAGR